jgi:hypothetical protein
MIGFCNSREGERTRDHLRSCSRSRRRLPAALLSQRKSRPPPSHRSCTRTTLARSWRRRLKACQRVLHRSPVRRTSQRHQARAKPFCAVVGGGLIDYEAITPELVADQIDKYLLKSV